MLTVEIVRGSCDHCGPKDVLVARLGFAQVAEVCQPRLATAEAEVYRAELTDASPPTLKTCPTCWRAGYRGEAPCACHLL